MDENVILVSMKSGHYDCNVFKALTAIDYDGKKTFAVCVSSTNVFEENDLKDSVLSLFDLAENTLSCSRILVFVEKYRTDFSEIVRALGYVGFASGEHLAFDDENLDEYCMLECDL